MNYYKDNCHHYKVLDSHRVVTVTGLGEFETSISFENYGGTTHPFMKYIDKRKVNPCTEKEYQTAFDKALNTINNLKT